MEITIRKPLYETEDGYIVGIYDKRVESAIINHRDLIIKTKGQEKKFSPDWIKKNCKTIQKVYLRPDEPMTEYLVFIPKNTKEEEIKEMSQLGIFG